uniref:Uncharacterized protein n=1 Tax=Kalanchoe fedtschenkoi TaxID=63787 RepID=A0A7N0UJX8_KALFE
MNLGSSERQESRDQQGMSCSLVKPKEIELGANKQAVAEHRTTCSGAAANENEAVPNPDKKTPGRTQPKLLKANNGPCSSCCLSLSNDSEISLNKTFFLAIISACLTISMIRIFQKKREHERKLQLLCMQWF